MLSRFGRRVVLTNSEATSTEFGEESTDACDAVQADASRASAVLLNEAIYRVGQSSLVGPNCVSTFKNLIASFLI